MSVTKKKKKKLSVCTEMLFILTLFEYSYIHPYLIGNRHACGMGEKIEKKRKGVRVCKRKIDIEQIF